VFHGKAVKEHYKDDLSFDGFIVHILESLKAISFAYPLFIGILWS